MSDTINITFDDFLKVDIRVGEIKSAEPVPKSDKLLRLTVDLGPLGQRTILAGIARSHKPELLPGKRVAVVVNLAPRKMMGIESHGMLLASSYDHEPNTPFLVEVHGSNGSRLG